MRRTGAGWTVVARLSALALALALAWPAGAAARTRPGTVTERRWMAAQTAAYGPTHAGQHRAARRAAIQHPRRRGARRRRDAEPSAPASQVGAWRPPQPVAGHPIHAVLLPTGKVLYFSYPLYSGPYAPTRGDAWVWDPATDEHTPVPPPPDVRGNNGAPAQIFCAGQSLLADGRVLVAGGTLSWEQAPLYYRGAWFTHIFDPWTLTWERGPDMRRGRWYPSQLLLDNTSTLLVSGYADDGMSLDDDLEVLDPAGAGNITKIGELRTELYPHLTQLPDRRVAVTGPGNGTDGAFGDDSALIDVATGAIADLPPMHRTRNGSTKVRWPAGPGESGSRVSILGGVGGGTVATSTEDSIDLTAPLPAFQERAALNVRRSYHNTTWLPDGSLVTVGGGAGKPEGSLYDLDPGAPQHAVELFDAPTRTWRLGAGQVHDRAYHSVALLLPDGTVWSSGDDDPRDGKDRESAEIYEPPYLHRGARPQIAWAPATVGRSRTFAIHTTGGEPVTHATLIAPSAVTHGVDMNSRFGPLPATRDPDQPGRVLLTAPGDASAFPPGYYMLFAVTADGVPSVARWVHLTDLPTTQPPEPAMTAGAIVPDDGPPSPGAAARPSGPRRTASTPRPGSYRVRRVPTRAALAGATRRRALLVGRRPWRRAVLEVTFGGRLAGRRVLGSPGPAFVPLAPWAVRALRRGAARAALVTITRR